MDIKDKIKKIKLKLANTYDYEIFNKILKIRNEISVRKNMLNDGLIKKKTHHSWIKERLPNKKNKFYIIYIKNEIAGMLILDEIEKKHKRGNWAFYLTKKFQNNYGAIIEYKFLNMFFKNNEFNKLNCIVLSFNQTVIKLHQKFGFIIEGVIKDYIYRNNLFLDLVLLGIKRDVWLEYKKKIEKIFKIN